jgi:hypothetical protein
MRTIGSAIALCMAISLAGVAPPASAVTPAEIQQDLEAAARAGDPAFTGLSAARGERLFKTTHGNDWSCASCHTANPLATGKHARTAKSIAPLAPSANPQRFTDTAKVEKWFKRNCNDVLGRPCSAREKGDVLIYLNSLSN